MRAACVVLVVALALLGYGSRPGAGKIGGASRGDGTNTPATLKRAERPCSTSDGAPDPEKDDPGTQIALPCAFGGWTALVRYKACFHRKKGTAHVKPVNWAESAVHESRRAICESVRRVRARTHNEAPRRA